MKRWLLCLHKNIYIATYHDQEELLNKRLELISKCRHENKFLLANNKKTINYQLLNFNTSTPSVSGIFRILHHSYLPDDRNNMRVENLKSTQLPN